MKPNTKVAIPLAIVALLLLSLGPAMARQAYEMAVPHGHGAPAPGAFAASDAASYGLDVATVPLTFAQLVGRAELVVIGTLEADAIVPFTANAAIPVSHRDPIVYAKGGYHDATFRVREYVKGTGPSNVSVRWLGSTASLIVGEHGHPELLVGGDYVLLLKKGEGVFVGGYEALGKRAAGVIHGGDARFVEYGDVSLAHLRSIARP